MKKRYKYIIGVIIAVAVGIGYLATANTGIDVATKVVSEEEAKLYFVEQGTVKSGDIMYVYPKLQGEVVTVNVNEGDSVKVGQVIATVSATDIDTQIQSIDNSIEKLKLQQSQAIKDESTRVQTVQKQINALNTQKEALLIQQKQGDVNTEEQITMQELLVQKAIDDYNIQKEQVDKMEILYQNNIISEMEYKEQVNMLESLDYGVVTANQQLEALKNGTVTNDDYYNNSVKQLTAQQDILKSSLANNSASINRLYELQINDLEIEKQSIQNNWENGEILAPTSGVVTSLNVKNVNYVYPQTEIAQITAEDELLLVTYISTRDDESIKVTDSVEIIVDKRKEDIKLKGEIVYIANEAKDIVSNLGVSESKIEVKIKPEKNEVLKLGYKADINFLLYDEPNKIVVPSEAVWKSEGKDYVWVVNNGELEQREVSVGVVLRSDVVIESGLVIGDVVVSDADNDVLKVGVKVKE